MDEPPPPLPPPALPTCVEGCEREDAQLPARSSPPITPCAPTSMPNMDPASNMWLPPVSQRGKPLAQLLVLLRPVFPRLRPSSPAYRRKGNGGVGVGRVRCKIRGSRGSRNILTCRHEGRVRGRGWGGETGGAHREIWA